MSDKQFEIIDNNSFTTNGKLNEKLIQFLTESDEIKIATGYFHIFSDKSPLNDIFSQIIAKKQKIDITIITSDRIGNLKKVLEFYLGLEDEGLLSPQEVRFVKNLKIVRPNIYILTEDEKNKTRFFHPKLYLFLKSGKCHSYIMGSSNFTEPGLNYNIELNIIETEELRVNEMVKWYDKALSIAKPISTDLISKLRVPDTTKDCLNISSETENPQSMDERPEIPIKKIILDPTMEDSINFSFNKQNSRKLVINSIEYYDPENGLVNEIKSNEIMAWSIGERKADKFTWIKIFITKDKEILKDYLIQNKIKPEYEWIIELEQKLDTETYSNILDSKITTIKDLNIQILLINGELIEGELNLIDL